ncbi:uL15 family ribosomal protein [Candidatus Pacearchaeota archaeon]|nr:uL15 family ribosomal protein [Candidatus Pacearchaeota archaeon]
MVDCLTNYLRVKPLVIALAGVHTSVNIMISKTHIAKRIQKKSNPEIVETILLAKKKNLLELAQKLSAPKSHYTSINLDVLNKMKEDNILVVGKVLGEGSIDRKIKISALGFSEQASEKLKSAKCEIKSIKDTLTQLKSLEGIKII